MEITTAVLSNRLQELELQKLGLVDQINAVMGAIQDCQFWLRQLNSVKADEEKPATEQRKSRRGKA
jgi:hypothetical protein